MRDSGTAMLGVGVASGKGRAREAADAATSAPLIERSIERATGVVYNITGGRDMTLAEVNEVSQVVSSLADPAANVIFGAVSFLFFKLFFFSFFFTLFFLRLFFFVFFFSNSLRLPRRHFAIKLVPQNPLFDALSLSNASLSLFYQTETQQKKRIKTGRRRRVRGRAARHDRRDGLSPFLRRRAARRRRRERLEGQEEQCRFLGGCSRGRCWKGREDDPGPPLLAGVGLKRRKRKK